MNKIFYFYFSHKNLLNDVTSVYVKAVEEAVVDLGYVVEYVYDIEAIPRGANVFTITDKCNYKVLKKCKPRVCVNWYQGIVPEEAALTYEGKWSRYPRKWYHSYLEKYTLKRNSLNIVVSNAMRDHYSRKYGLNLDNWFVMPCFNCSLDEKSFGVERYAKPTFVYAGSMAKWQCVEQTVSVFKRLKQQLPAAELYIYTREKDQARQIAESMGVEINIDSMSPEALNQRMKQFKYGLLFRDNISVNNVATPTKINNYMACGLIPVFSDVVEDYKAVSCQNPYMITFNGEDDFIRKVVEFEQESIDASKILDAHRFTFRTYWNIPQYKTVLKKELGKILSEK